MYKVYKITNLVNNKIYIGCTQQTLEERFESHVVSAVKKNKNAIFLASIRKYGRENFHMELIQEYSSQEDMYTGEIYWIKYFDSQNREIGYNMTPGGGGGPTNLGKTFDDDHKLKISKANAGKQIKSRRRFSDEIEKIICDKYISGISFYDLANEYNCYRSLIIAIVDRANIPHRKNNYSNCHKNYKYTEEQQKKMCEMYLSGNYSRNAISKYFNCCSTTVRDILLRNNVKL